MLSTLISNRIQKKNWTGSWRRRGSIYSGLLQKPIQPPIPIAQCILLQSIVGKRRFFYCLGKSRRIEWIASENGSWQTWQAKLRKLVRDLGGSFESCMLLLGALHAITMAFVPDSYDTCNHNFLQRKGTQLNASPKSSINSTSDQISINCHKLKLNSSEKMAVVANLTVDWHYVHRRPWQQKGVDHKAMYRSALNISGKDKLG